MKRVTIVFLVVMLCWPLVVQAELAAAVQKDFAVVEGYVVMPVNDEFIVDLDARNHLVIGDILALVSPGKKILHPTTSEVIGSVDNVLGYLQVSRVLSGYSYAKTLTEGLSPEAGDKVKRFEQVPAILKSETGQDAAMMRTITTALPQFKWLEASQGSQALLTFVLQDGALNVMTQAGDSLHRYRITEDQQLVSQAASAPRPFVTPQVQPEPKLLQRFANAIMGTVEKTNEKRFAEMDEAIIRNQLTSRADIWMGPHLTGHPIAMAVADLDGDGLQEVAVVLDNKITIARVVDGTFQKIDEIEISAARQIFSMDALDLDGDNRSELYLSAVRGNSPASFAVQFNGGEYGISIDNVRWFLRALTLPGEKGSFLAGQRMGDHEKVYADEVFRVQRDGDQLTKGSAVPLPDKLNLFNFLPFVDEQGRNNYAYLTDGDYLKVLSSSGAEYWESSGYFGGSETCFTPETKLRDADIMPTCMRPRMLLMPDNEILVAQNDGQRMVQRYRKFDKSRLVSLAWNGFNLNESWVTASQPGYLGDFAYADADNDGQDELVMAVKFNHAGLTDDAISSIVMYELN